MNTRQKVANMTEDEVVMALMESLPIPADRSGPAAKEFYKTLIKSQSRAVDMEVARRMKQMGFLTKLRYLFT